MNKIYIFSLLNEVWQEFEDLKYSAEGVGVKLHKGNLIVFGGFNGDERIKRIYFDKREGELVEKASFYCNSYFFEGNIYGECSYKEG